MSVSQTAESPAWRPKAIIFDLLTGLIDSWTLWDASTPSGNPEEGRRWRSHYLATTFAAGAYTPYEGHVREAARAVGLPESAPEALLRDWGTLQPWPEAGEILGQLKERGYKLGVVTNCSIDMGNVAARRVSERAGAEAGDHVFDAVVTAEESGFYKPVGKAYEAILVALGVEARDALFVAGSPGDVDGATKAGMKVVWHNRVGLDKKGDAVPLREGRTLDDTLRDFL